MEKAMNKSDYIKRMKQKLETNPISVISTDTGYDIELDDELHEILAWVIQTRYEITLEELLEQFFHWIAKEPEAFETWIKAELTKDGESGE